MEKLFKNFNQNFFKKSTLTLEFFDKECLFSTINFVVRFTIDDVGVNGNYNGYWVEIVHKERGTICKKFFRFRDYLEMNHRQNTQPQYHVWYDTRSNGGEFDWYISTPKDESQMVKEMEKWVNMIIN